MKIFFQFVFFLSIFLSSKVVGHEYPFANDLTFFFSGIFAAAVAIQFAE